MKDSVEKEKTRKTETKKVEGKKVEATKKGVKKVDAKKVEVSKEETKKINSAKTEKGTEEKSHKKAWIIACSIIGGLAVAGLAAWGIVTMVLANQPLEQDWAQTYYVYLDENPLEPELKDADGEMIATADEYELSFYDVEGVDEPVMTVDYVAGDTEYLTYYWVEGKDGVKRAVLSEPSEIQLLYNIKEEKNEYYIHYEKEGTDYYKSLSDEILSLTDADDANHVKDVSEYKFKEDDVKKVTDKDGKEHSISKFEETFVEVEEEKEVATLPVNYNKDDLKSAVRDEAYEYQVLEEVAKKHAEMIKQVIADIENRQREIKDVEEENAKIEAEKKAEEEKRRAEEEAKKGIKLESYTIAYGTYLMDDDWVGEEYASQNTLVLKPNGVCTYGGKACTWAKSRKDFTQSPESTNIHECITVTPTAGGYGTTVYAYSNRELGDGDIEHYIYAGY